jgi:predicted nucleic acid-binding Zn ribbon protein
MRALVHVIPAALRELLRGMPLSDGKVGFAWRAAVGPAFERATAVKLEGGVLLVETASAEWAREIRRSTGTILERLQAFLGRDTVTRIEVRLNTSLKPGA